MDNRKTRGKQAKEDKRPVQLELPWGKPVVQGNFDGDETCPRCRRTLMKQGCRFCLNCSYTSCGLD